MMKLLLHIGIVALILLSSQLHAQAPQGINYQGVARGLDGQPIANKYISIRISVLNESSSGPVEYEEVHEAKTNSFGLFTLVIGQGTRGTNDFSFIGWTTGPKWLQIEMDENGGSNFKLMGSQQLMSVPYALYAERSGNGYQAGQGISISNNMISNAGDGDNDPNNELISEVTLGTDNKLRITDAGGTKETDLSGLLGASQDLSNVLVEGNSAGNSTITNLGAPTGPSDAATKAYVDAHADGDASATNELQDLSQVLTRGKDAGGLTIENIGTPTSNGDAATKAYVDAHFDGDASDTNEIQNLSQVLAEGNNAGGLKITNIGAPTLNEDAATKAYVDAHTDGDANATNELQDLGQVLSQGNNAGGLKIENVGTPTINTDAATKAYVDAHTDGDASDTNEIQDLTLSGNTLILSGDATTVNLAPFLDNTDNQNLANVLGFGNNAGGLRIENLGVPTTNTDAATKAYVDAHTDGDASPTNEIQDLSLNSNILKITNNAGATEINLSSYLDNTDNQNLSSTASGTNRQINISGGTGTTINVADNDNSPTNEIQILSKTGGTVSLSNGGGSFNANDASGNTITNLADPVNIQDAATKNYVDLADIALGSRISNTFAFKSDFQFVNSTGSTLNNQDITLNGDEFGDFNVLFGNTFVAPENGIYLFVVEGNFSGANTGGRISISANGIKTNISIATSYNTSTTPNYSGSFLYKLNAGEIVKLVGDNVFVGDSFTGRFSGFKL